MPEADRELDRLDRLLAVERHGLAVGLDLPAVPRPQVWVPQVWRIAEGVAGGLAKRPALGLELLAGVEQAVPGVREGLQPNLLEPRLAIGDQPTADSERHADPAAADGSDLLGDVVIAALILANVLGHVARIGEAFRIELRPVADRYDDIGPVPDWIAEVIRACRSLALMFSTFSVMPVAFWHSCVIWPLSRTSDAGTKSEGPISHRDLCSNP